MKKSWLCGLILLGFLFSTNFSLAQLNLKIGYLNSYTKASVIDEIVTEYNLSNSWLETEFKPLRFMHGAQLGLRYRWDFIAVELGWETMSRVKNASGLDPMTQSGFTKNIYFQEVSYNLAFENYFGMIGYGATVEYNDFRIKTDIPGLNKKRTFLREPFLSTKLYAIITIPGNRLMSTTIKPYVELPWSSINLSGLSTELDVVLVNPNSPIDQRLMHFGIMISFYNGLQKEN